MPTELRVLLVEDSEEDALLNLREVRRSYPGVASERVQDEHAMRGALERGEWDVVIADWSMPRFTALEALRTLRESRRDIPCIVVSGTVSEDAAVEAMRAGARDFMSKRNLTRLVPAIDREVNEARAREARRRAEDALRRTEDQLRQAQKMEAVGRLAGGIAHDFNNMLSVILSLSMLLMTEGPEADEEQRRADLRAIHDAGSRAADLTRQLLAFSRQQVLAPQRIDLNEVITNLEKMLRRVLGEDVELRTDLAPALGAVRADRANVEQVIMNLVVNARDAMPDGGKLVIETYDVVLDASHAGTRLAPKPGPHVALVVSDTGIGMDEATQARVFEPFFTTKDVGKGTGLGLSTVLGIVEQNDGSIDLSSAVGAGTTFKIFFPRAQSESDVRALRPTAAADDETPVTETLLLIEDEQRVRDVASAILTRHGYTVLTAAGLDEACAAAHTHGGTIDLVVTDVVLPHVSGPDIVKRLRRERAGLKVLFMSGYLGDAARHRELFESGVPFLQKPFTPETLCRKVREALDAPSAELPS